ncbi:flagellar protein FlgN [Bermanella marisrubri]|uniref:Flagella synthesis protein FlgN n=1 Tax=Bermanella marisrubri TaxID=207949 RepID=Q1N310_9GAMM|nr:flagellar protein FlgN [Bermanella marisrubri]EAT12509.1 hypothetical protein RED65_06428 [Oceanobacter sp. RED65] [Bermanella marisrubri]QIZ84931.1 flagellar protein FlgN [Bermanella marisrubri]
MSDDIAQQLESLLLAEQDVLLQLQQTLEQESRALLDRDIKTIDETAKNKRQLLLTFEKQVGSRQDYLSTHSVTADEDGLKSLIDQQGSNKKDNLITLWNTIRALFSQVITLNEENGIVIQHSRLRTRNLLNILHADRIQPNLYNEKGSAKDSSGSHKLGKA